MNKVLILAIILTATISLGQQISPVNAECGKKCSGQLTVTNNTLASMVLTLRPRSMVITSNGFTASETVEDDVKLSTMSVRLAPKQAFVVDYHIRCKVLPCVTGVAAAMMGRQMAQVGGKQFPVQIVLIETVYSCEKSSGCRDSVLKAANIFKPDQPGASN